MESLRAVRGGRMKNKRQIGAENLADNSTMATDHASTSAGLPHRVESPPLRLRGNPLHRKNRAFPGGGFVQH